MEAPSLQHQHDKPLAAQLQPSASPPQFTPLDRETRTHVDTETMCWHLGFAQQTARLWACKETYPEGLRPIRVNGRLKWPVAGIRKTLGGGLMNAALPMLDEGASARDASPLKQELQPRNCADADCGVKRFATLQAALALAGFSLTRAADGYYLIERWDQSRNLETLNQVEQLQRSVAK